MSEIEFKAGDLVLLSTGEYSDYGVTGLVRVVLDTWRPAERMQQWLDEHPDQLPKYSFNDLAFVEWLLGLGDVEKVDFDYLHLGDYGTAELEAACGSWEPERPEEPVRAATTTTVSLIDLVYAKFKDD